MNLLHTSKLELRKFDERLRPKYAILSHTWDDHELSYHDMVSGNLPNLPGYEKIKRSCETVKAKYDWLWIDTCGIDKTDSGELAEAINSMYKWYAESDMCYVHLKDFIYKGSESDDDGYLLDCLKDCRWFTRGWTLQELLAPKRVLFLDQTWTVFGNKHSLHAVLSKITGIPSKVLTGVWSPQDCNVAQRMSWAAQRKTTKSEDIAYCLLGLFDIHMLPIYGEGPHKAFLRLQQEILGRWSDHSIFVWTIAHDPRNVGLLASSPEAFCKHRECFTWLGVDNSSSSEPFDPFADMIPLEPAPVMVEVGANGTVDTQTIVIEDGIGSRNISTPSIGPQGLHVSLLADEGLQLIEHIQPTRSDMLKEYYVCFDLAYRQGNNHVNILLPVYLDIILGFQSHDISRRGHLTRASSPLERNCQYQMITNAKRFIRQEICFTQQAPSVRPIQTSNFKFIELPNTAVVTGITFEMGQNDDNKSFSVGDLCSGIQAFGGSIAFSHSYKSSKVCCNNANFLVNFGAHGYYLKPWCSVTTGRAGPIAEAELIKPSLEYWRNLERQSSRFKCAAQRQLVPEFCKHTIIVSMNPVITYDGPVTSEYEVSIRICDEFQGVDLQSLDSLETG
jgi:Heterokaryon incompatibility protein (HET)